GPFFYGVRPVDGRYFAGILFLADLPFKPEGFFLAGIDDELPDAAGARFSLNLFFPGPGRVQGKQADACPCRWLIIYRQTDRPDSRRRLPPTVVDGVLFFI